MDSIPSGTPVPRKYVPAGRFLIVLFLLGLCLYGFVEFWIFQKPFSSRNIQGTIGGAIPFALFPSLIVVPWRLIQRRSGRLTNVPIFIGGALAILIALVLVTNVLRMLQAGD
jgi:hypothetical protein